MLRRSIATIFVVASTLTLAVVVVQPAAASNGSRDGCVSLFVEYESRMGETSRFVEYAEARNVCEPFRGAFYTDNVRSPYSEGPAPHRVTVNRRVDRGDYICSAVNDTEQIRGTTCTEIV